MKLDVSVPVRQSKLFRLEWVDFAAYIKANDRLPFSTHVSKGGQWLRYISKKLQYRHISPAPVDRTSENVW